MYNAPLKSGLKTNMSYNGASTILRPIYNFGKNQKKEESS